MMMMEFVGIFSDILKEDIEQDIILVKRKTYSIIHNTKIMRTMALSMLPELKKDKALLSVIYAKNSEFNHTDQDVMVSISFKLYHNDLLITFNP